MAGTVRVKGLRELDRALNAYQKDLKTEMRKELRVVAEPVRALAEQMAVGNISNIGGVWSRMRLGVTSKVVYVAPRARPKGTGTGRPNLGPLLMERAMQPALDSKTGDVINGFENMIDRLTARHGF